MRNKIIFYQDEKTGKNIIETIENAPGFCLRPGDIITLNTIVFDRNKYPDVKEILETYVVISVEKRITKRYLVGKPVDYSYTTYVSVKPLKDGV